MAQRANTTVAECFLMYEFVSLIGSHTMPGQRHSQTTPTSLGQGCMSLGVTCHQHSWQKDRGLLRATSAVTRGVERTPNKSQHRKLTLEKKIPPPLLPGLELATFRSRVRSSRDLPAVPAPTQVITPITYCVSELCLLTYNIMLHQSRTGNQV